MVQIFFMGVLLAYMSMPASKAGAVEYLGDFCWELAPGKVLMMGFTNIGNGHLLVSGRTASGGDTMEVFSGGAEIAGDKVYITLNSAGSNNSYTWSFIHRAVLDLNTLVITDEAMGIDHDKNSSDPQNSYTDYDGPFTLTYVPCP